LAKKKAIIYSASLSLRAPRFPANRSAWLYRLVSQITRTNVTL